MELKQFIAQIRFQTIQPDTPSAQRSQREEIENTLLPAGCSHFAERIAPLEALPRMSSFALTAILGFALQKLPAGQIYLNIGVWHGYSLLAAILLSPQSRCVGVDNFSEFGGPRQEFLQRFRQLQGRGHSFYDLDYRDYFKRYQRTPIGLYFYDGFHAYADQREALELAHPWLAPGAIILIDDTNTVDPRQASLDFLEAYPEYTLLADLRTCGHQHPTFWNGLMVLRKDA